MEQRLNQLETFTRTYNHNQGRALANGIITIPVIVHVLYQNSTENISDALINSQIAVLTDDFRRMNNDANNTPADFQGVASDSEIEFCLTSVIRVPTTVGSFGTNDSMKFSSSGGSDAVNTASSLNIWVCEVGGGILGYAQFPGGSAATDGVVIDYRYFGVTNSGPYGLGRTATHEVGHWLNLRHIWGDGACSVDDFISDTPSASGPNYTGSPCTYPGPNSCRPKRNSTEVDFPDMFQNYMDYSDDGCMNLFTTGQRDRMWAAINNSRPALLSAPCDGTLPPPPPASEICNNGIDDDGDGLVDCADPDCGSDPLCANPGTCNPPTNLQHTRQQGGRAALLSWNASTGANDYDVEVFSGSTLIASGTIAGTSATVSGLTKNAAYTWRVRANCTGSTSAWADGAFNARLGAANIQEEIMAYPNPVKDGMVILNWDLASTDNALPSIAAFVPGAQSQSPALIQMHDITGKPVISKNVAAGIQTEQLDVSQLPAGIYIIRVINASGTSASVKLIKQ